MDIRKSVARRIATYTLAFLFLVSSVAYACPDIYRLATHRHHSSFDEVAPEQYPCGDSDNSASHSAWYQALRDRLLTPLTELSSPVRYRVRSIADEAPVVTETFFFAYLSTSPYQPPPKVSLTLRYNVLRI